jgi:hypothetical protein
VTAPNRASRRTIRRPAAAGLVALALALGLALAGGLGGSAGGTRAAAQAGGGVTAVTDASIPAHNATMIGSASDGETWGVGETGRDLQTHEELWGIVHYRPGAGWSQEGWLQAGGQTASASFGAPKSPLVGEITPSGAGALLASLGTAPAPCGREILLIHNPGGAFQETEEVPEALLKAGECLFTAKRAPLLAALDESGHAGALVVPVNTAGSGVAENGVLHWDGSKWTREQIEVPQNSEADFRVLALSASSPTNAWLLGQLSQSLQPGAVALFQRVPGSGGSPPTWHQVAIDKGGTPGQPLSVLGEPVTVTGSGEPPIVAAPVLTATGAGVWVDGETKDGRLTMFFKPGEGVKGVWCKFSTQCEEEGAGLEEEVPVGPSRSFAWDNSSMPFGERVVTGMSEGVTLRLEGTRFRRVLALGGGSENVGAKFGAAFANPREGWLGATLLPVHLTQSHEGVDQLTQYPVPFHHALLAIAAQPGAPAGSLASQALAVGNNGEVGRYTPGEGWQPESLLNAGGRRATPRLRAVAWPTPERAYAVGDLGQMWLWRGETGLWEPDPAAPRNFRGNLLGVAFAPNEPSRGYAVGQQGVLLRYGKSWTQEPQEAIPAAAQGASFTSIAFAGSEAIVAFRQPHTNTDGTQGYTGGVLVNSGSGWTVDEGATRPLGPGGLPWAVAGLPDGGAAVSGEDIFGSPLVLEREGGPPVAWQAAPPYPGVSAPGSLALFREGGALRAVGAGSIVSTRNADFGEAPPPPGFPPNLATPYPAVNGNVLRQTPSGWSDEQHDLTEARPTAGEWADYDLPARPDPTAAVLVDPGGSQGWAVGGEIDTSSGGRLDTAEAARYREPQSTPPGLSSSPVQATGSEASAITFAIGGGAQCAAPCADRANTAIGPDVWLSTALQSASEIKRGSGKAVDAFIYTGPRVTNGEHLTANNTLRPPYHREYARYAELLSNPQLPTLVAPSATDRVGSEGECKFREAFAGFGLPFATPKSECSGEAGNYGYYEENRGQERHEVHVIVLDDSGGVDETQRMWLEGELKAAAAAKQTAVAVGNGDLASEVEKNAEGARETVEALVNPSEGASAYFYDAPQRNVKSQLRIAGVGSIPAYGSGTLGYANALQSERQDYTGHSGYLLAEVPLDRSPVPTPRLIPNIGELALEAKDGVLLRRSQSALFAALARRPRAGCVTNGTRNECESSQYIPIPANCVGIACASAILPEYEFSSVREGEIGEFVEPNLASADPHSVLLGANGKPIPDKRSGLFCALNVGTTTATISTGGLSASLAITIQAGSVRRPCGTAPLNEVASQQQASAPAPPPPAPAPAPAPAGSAPSAAPPLPVPPPPASPVPPVRPAPPQPPAFLPLPAVTAAQLAFVPLPVPTPARPTPPSGTSAVTSPVEVAEKEEEQEEAPESVSNKAVAYHPAEHEPAPEYILGVILLAAFAGASIRRPRRNARVSRIAPATLSAQRAQRRASRTRVTKW